MVPNGVGKALNPWNRIAANCRSGKFRYVLDREEVGDL